MNMAALWSLPVVYVCENNLYNEYTHYRESTAGDVLARPRAFGIHAVEVDGQDVRGVYGAATKLVERCRGGEGPAFLLCHTYRQHGHHVGDVDRGYYRSKDEEERWQRERDPLSTLGTWLVEEGHVDPERLRGLEGEVREEVEDGVRRALDAPYPDPSE